MILALDLGTKTGWAMSQRGEVILTGMINLKGGRFEGGGMRFLRFEQWLNSLDIKPTVVVFEEVRRHLGTDAAHVYGGLLAILTKWCESNKIPYKGYGVGTIKKFATGKGNALKEHMIAAAQKHRPEITDDNEADAFWILQLCLSEVNA